MQLVTGDTVKTPIWDQYRTIIKNSDENKKFDDFEFIERFEFYERAKKAYAVIAKSKTALYANIILRNSVVV